MSLRIALTHVYSWPEVRRGGERYLHELAAALASAGHEVTILTTGREAGRQEQLGVPVRYLRRRSLAPSRFGAVSDEAAFAVQASARLGWRRIDVWHALGTADAAAATCLGRVRGFRSVYTELGVPIRSYREGRPDRRLHRAVVRGVDSYVCLSTYAAGVLERDFGRQGTLVPGGVDTTSFVPAPARHPNPVLLYSGSFDEPRKRLALLVEAVALLRAEMPDLELWLSGSGDLERITEAAPVAARAALVPLGPGRADDQAGRYGAAWATVLPSRHEAFGLCLLESLSCGTPVVAMADGGGPADLVGPGTGCLSAPDAASLAAACRDALSIARTPGIVDSCRAVAERFDWSKSIVPAMEAAYGAG